MYDNLYWLRKRLWFLENIVYFVLLLVHSQMSKLIDATFEEAMGVIYSVKLDLLTD